MNRQFIVVTQASNLDTILLNISHIRAIYPSKEVFGGAFIEMYSYKRKVYGLEVTDSVRELITQLEDAFN